MVLEAFDQDQGAFAQGLVAFVQDQEASFAQVLVAYQVLEYLDVKIVQVMEDLEAFDQDRGAFVQDQEAFDLVDLEDLVASYQILKDLEANQVLDLGVPFEGVCYVLDREVPFVGVYFETLVQDLP